MANEKLQAVYCPVCGQPKRQLGSTLYGIPTCRKCVDAFALRRNLAWFAEWIICIAPAIVARIVETTLSLEARLGNPSDEDIAKILFILFGWMLSLALMILFVFKDGVAGYSPLKYALGLRVMDVRTGQPAGLVASVKRNALPAIVPIIALVCSAQLRKGPRWGDGFAKAKVIWTKHAKSPVFDVSPVPLVAEVSPQAAVVHTAAEDGNPYRAPHA
ncbi:MAG: RDD family protein [Pirellulales bacterium]